MFFINWKKNLFLLLYFVLFITSFSSQNQQMCAEFWIQNKDNNFFSTKAVTIVRKPHYFFNLFLLFSTSCIKAIKLKLTCYCIKKSMFFLMFLMKKLHQQRLQSFFYNNIVFSLNDSINGVSFNIDLSIIGLDHRFGQ